MYSAKTADSIEMLFGIESQMDLRNHNRWGPSGKGAIFWRGMSGWIMERIYLNVARIVPEQHSGLGIFLLFTACCVCSWHFLVWGKESIARNVTYRENAATGMRTSFRRRGLSPNYTL